MKKIKLLMLMYMLGIVSNIYAQTNPNVDYTYTLSKGATVLDQSIINEVAAQAKAASGREDSYSASVIIPQGITIEVKNGTEAVSIPTGMSLYLIGEGEETTRPSLIFPYKLDIPGSHNVIQFQNLNLYGSTSSASNSLYLINQSVTATNTSQVSFQSCKLMNFGRSIIRLQTTGGAIYNVAVDDCIFQDLGADSYPVFYNQSTGGIENIEITNTTFDTCKYYIFRHNNTSGGGVKTAKFSDCTFYNCIANGSFLFDNTTSFECSITMTNIIMGKLFGNGKGIRAKGTYIYYYTTFDGYYQLSDVTWGGNKINAGMWGGTEKSKYSSSEIFNDPESHDFTLKHYLDAGDPRWKTEGESIAIDETNFPDENFRSYLLSQEYGTDAMLTEKEILSIPTLRLSGMQIQNLKGIEYFTELNSLTCSNNQLSTLDISQNWKLIQLYCAKNKLSSLDLSNNSLKTLQCSYNEFTTLDLSNQENLYYLDCAGNKLKSLDVSKCPIIGTIRCDQNYISGEGMQNLINSLPVNKGNLRIYYNENDNNIITRAQVEAAKGKDWTVYCSNGSEWIEYEGSDIVIVEDYEEPVATIADEEYYSLDLSSSDVAYADMVSVNETGKGRITIVDEGLQFSQGENINLALSDLQNGKIIKFTFTGSMRCASGKLIASNAQSYSFPFVTDAMMEIESDTEYSIAEDGNLVIEMETTDAPVELKSITITEPTGVSIVETSTSNPSSSKTYNLAGQQVKANSNGLLIQGGKKIIKH